jgi:trypsin-like peptidase
VSRVTGTIRARQWLRFAATLMTLTALVPARAPAAPVLTHIQPGAPMTDPTRTPDKTVPYSFHRCTMGFILADARGALYMITAGHCVQRKGARVHSETGQAIGTVVYRLKSGTDDVALVRIDRAAYRQVSPSVRDWGGPTGVATPQTVKRFDEIQFTGFSFVLGDIPQTRARTGILISQDRVHYLADTSASEGDSGGPFIDARTGQAIGIVRDFGLTDVPPVTDDGPTVQRILTLLARAGYRLHLKTAPHSR